MMTVLLVFEVLRGHGTESEAARLRSEIETELGKVEWQATKIHTTFTKKWLSPKNHQVTEEFEKRLSVARVSADANAARVEYAFLVGLGPLGGTDQSLPVDLLKGG